MQRIFVVLALASLLFSLATMGLGLSLGDVHNPADLMTQRWATIHRLSGIVSGLALMLTEGILVTWFIGTSRWCREVCEPYGLDLELAARSNRLKRRAFPWAVGAMLAMVGLVALGGAADPAASLRLEPVAGLTWSQIHLIGACLILPFIGYAFLAQYEAVLANTAIIEEILKRVKQIRAEKGLDS